MKDAALIAALIALVGALITFRIRRNVRHYPIRCDLCGLMIESFDDAIWHGLGNCVDICERCMGSGEEPKPQPPESSTPSIMEELMTAKPELSLDLDSDHAQQRRSRPLRQRDTPHQCSFGSDDSSLNW